MEDRIHRGSSLLFMRLCSAYDSAKRNPLFTMRYSSGFVTNSLGFVSTTERGGEVEAEVSRACVSVNRDRIVPKKHDFAVQLPAAKFEGLSFNGQSPGVTGRWRENMQRPPARLFRTFRS